MALAPPRYPTSRYEPSPLVDLSARSERERLSRSAIKAFLNIIEKWGVRDEDARALLGGMSNGPFLGGPQGTRAAWTPQRGEAKVLACGGETVSDPTGLTIYTSTSPAWRMYSTSMPRSQTRSGRWSASTRARSSSSARCANQSRPSPGGSSATTTSTGATEPPIWPNVGAPSRATGSRARSA